MEIAQKSWELDNGVKLVDPSRDALYRYDAAAHQAATAHKAWKTEREYFKHVRISAVALIKMVMHARSGGSLEVMGLMQGYVDGDTFVVTDAFRLPVEGTETRVNAQDEANEYLVEYLDLCRSQGRSENVVGWYHSHPGYGCWLSGIDVETQALQQQFNEPFLAVVVDPDRTINAGKVEIGAFRTHGPLVDPATGIPVPGGGMPGPAKFDADGKLQSTSASASAGGPPASAAMATTDDGFQAVPLAKAAEFGAHASRYYPLEVSHFKSTLDSHLLELLWHKYWVQTLSQAPLLTNRDYGNKQILDLGQKIKEVAGMVAKAQRNGPVGGTPGLVGGATAALDDRLEKVARDGGLVAAAERMGLMAVDVKAKIFGGLRSKATCQ